MRGEGRVSERVIREREERGRRENSGKREGRADCISRQSLLKSRREKYRKERENMGIMEESAMR